MASAPASLARRRLAALYRVVDALGWTHGIYNHISLRTASGGFLVQPFGQLYSEVTPESLVALDASGEVIERGSTAFGFSRAAFVLHSTIHDALPDRAHCVMHTHTPAGSAVSALRCGLLPISQEALVVGPVAYCAYGGILIDDAQRRDIARATALGGNAIILSNHGLVTFGRTCGEALHFMYNLQHACQAQLAALAAAGGDASRLIALDESIQRQVRSVTSVGGGGVGIGGAAERPPVGEMELDAWIRALRLPWQT